MSTTTHRPASPKQVAFIERLVAERDIEALSGHAYERAFDVATGAGKAISGAEARVTIDALLAAPPKVDAPAEPPEGIHHHDGTIYRVQTAKTSGKRYATALVEVAGRYSHGAAGNATEWAWDYVGRRPFLVLSEATYLTLEQAKAFGVAHGVCAVCGARLSNPDSVERGIGPVCASRL